MPIYEYTCGSCEHEFEELVRSSADEASVACPNCGASKVLRRLSVFAARQGASSPQPAPRGGPCGRCGDPNGPCGA